MAIYVPKAILLHAALATLSTELTTFDDIIVHHPNRLPAELLLIIRTHLLSTLTTHLFLDSTRALSEYEENLQRLLCSDCISYNHDIYGPDIWQWQQFSGPCHCTQTLQEGLLEPSMNPQQFANPRHWLEHHLSLQVARLSPTPSPTPSIWDVVTEVLHRHHCELFKEDLDDFTAMPGTPLSRSGVNAFYYRRVINYYEAIKPRSTPTIRIRPLDCSLRSLESKGIGEVGEAGDTFRTDIILSRTSLDLYLALELKDVFSSPREPVAPCPAVVSDGNDVPGQKPTFLLSFYAPPVLHGVVKTYSFLSTVLGAFVSMPMTIATFALTIVCFYSRPIALRVGV